MKKILLIISFAICYTQLMGQTKTELLNEIIKINILEDEDKGLTMEIPDGPYKQISQPDNYENYLKLKKYLSDADIIQFAKDKNPILRMFAIRDIIKSGSKEFNLFEAFKNECSKVDLVEIKRGCDRYHAYTYEIFLDDVYYSRGKGTYWGKESLEILLGKMYNYFISLDRDMNHSTYRIIFARHIFDMDKHELITDLVYKNNNFYAYEYLEKNNPTLFKQLDNKYFTQIFPEQTFKNKNQVVYLCAFIHYASRTKNRILREKLILKLNALDKWLERFPELQYRVSNAQNDEINEK